MDYYCFRFAANPNFSLVRDLVDWRMRFFPGLIWGDFMIWSLWESPYHNTNIFLDTIMSYECRNLAKNYASACLYYHPRRKMLLSNDQKIVNARKNTVSAANSAFCVFC